MRRKHRKYNISLCENDFLFCEMSGKDLGAIYIIGQDTVRETGQSI